MGRWWRDLDRILRGEATRSRALGRGTIEVQAGGVSFVLLVLAMAYGACMGSFALFQGNDAAGWRLLAAVVKVPLLFALTLVVTFPSLYVFNALVGSRLRITAVLRLLVASLAVIITVLASLGPIVAFFSASTTSYHFMVLLNVAVYGVAGLLGMGFLLQTLHRLSLIKPEPIPLTADDVGDEKPDGLDAPADPAQPGGLEHEPENDRAFRKNVRTVFRCWILLFALVGSQMGWVLRPFIGSPDHPFSWFRPRESSFFQAVWQAFSGLLS